jgi:predicted ATPase/DNA-binding NarL/FixJ family response regulator/DNA-binding XRE family transcriptional regulator
MVDAGIVAFPVRTADCGDTIERISALRAALGLSQEQLAHRLGVAFATVNRWEQGHTAISARGLIAVAQLEAEIAAAGQPAPTLPATHSTFVGRAREVRELRRLLSESRLICITGPAGVGKTRLTVQVLNDIADPVVFVRLTRTDPTVDLVGAALGLPPGCSLDDICRRLSAAPSVLVLDGAQSTRPAVIALAERVLASAARLRIVVTSRSVLGIAGETSWTLAPLPSEDAVALFTTRARERLAAAELEAIDDPAALAELGRQLEGLPLAIELAAGWASTLSMPDIGAFLPGRRFGAQPADQLWCDIDASYLALDDPERALAVALVVFAGAFTLEAARVVLALSGPDLARQLRNLVDSSWLRVDHDGGGNRFVMLNVQRDYAAARLTAGPTLVDRQARHARYYLDLAIRSKTELTGADRLRWGSLLHASEPDLTASLEWAAANDTDAGLAASANLWRWWLTSAQIPAGRAWLAMFLDATDEHDDEPVGRALGSAGVLAVESGDYRAAVTYAARALKIFDASGDRTQAAFAATILGSAHRYLGQRQQARTHFEIAMAYREALDDERGMSVALNNLALLALDDEDLSRSRDLFERSLLLKRKLGDPRSVAIGLANLCDVLIRMTDLTPARRALTEAAALAAELGDHQLIGTLASNQADLAAATEDWAEVVEQYHVALAAYRQAETSHDVILALVGAGRALQRLGRTDEAIGHLREAETLAAQSGNPQRQSEVRAALVEVDEQPVNPRPNGITRRQAEVLACVAIGLSNKQIAARLHLEVATVERHLTTSYRNLGLRGRVEAAQYARRHGLLSPP